MRDSRDVRVLVGERIRTARLAAGMSQEVLSEISGLHRTYISDTERGHRNLTLESLAAIARALKIKPADLLEGVE